MRDAETKRLHSIWCGMKQRCGNPNAVNAKYYHDKGIKVCRTWQTSFAAFAAWALKHGYDNTKSLDRKNTSGNYSPQNCAWVTRAEQVNNRTCTRWVDGMPLKHYCLANGMNYSTVCARIRRGATTEQAIGREVEKCQ